MNSAVESGSTSPAVKVARIYIRVSTDHQDLDRQRRLIEEAKNAGYYIAGTYEEKASGVRADRPELVRMIGDLQPGDVVIAEQMDRISRLPLNEAQKLVDTIRDKGARLAIPGVIDLSELAGNASGTPKIVLEAVQDMLLRIALQQAREDYEIRRKRQREGIDRAKADGKYQGRPPDRARHARIIALRERGATASETARLVGCSLSLVKRVWRGHKAAQN